MMYNNISNFTVILMFEALKTIPSLFSNAIKILLKILTLLSKNMFCFSRKECSLEVLKPQNHLIATKRSQEIVQLLINSSKHFYSDEHTFIKSYLSTYFSIKNQQLVEDTRKFIEKCNKKNYHFDQL